MRVVHHLKWNERAAGIQESQAFTFNYYDQYEYHHLVSHLFGPRVHMKYRELENFAKAQCSLLRQDNLTIAVLFADASLSVGCLLS